MPLQLPTTTSAASRRRTPRSCSPASSKPPTRRAPRQQLHDWFLPDFEFETWVVAVDGAPIGHVTVSGHQLVHTVEHGISYDERVLIKHRT
jgi:hypothetical protein